MSVMTTTRAFGKKGSGADADDGPGAAIAIPLAKAPASTAGSTHRGSPTVMAW
jgi:hypothetical protein